MHPSAPRSDRRAWHAVHRYAWRDAPVPALDDAWEPRDLLSVVIPAFDCQPQLDLTLAALHAQRYPQDLFEVVVADDGSAQPLRIPDTAPVNTRILRLDRTNQWGRARACAAGAQAAAGEILLFLDADMIVFEDHLRAHSRWHHVLADAVTLGRKRFVDTTGITVAQVTAAGEAGAVSDLLADRPHQDHDWVDKVIADTDDLTRYHPEMFRAAVGANVGMRATLYQECGGFRPALRAGEDMEMGYRLMAAGAVFIPERAAQSWHQGPATFMSNAEEVRRRNNPHFTNLIPVPGRFRPPAENRQYTVPMVGVVVASDRGAAEEQVRRCVDAVLASDELDLRVHVAGADDPDTLIAWYQGEPRVVLSDSTPASCHPSRFTIEVPAHAGVGPATLRLLVELAETQDLGLVRAGVTPEGSEHLTVWRTAALHRARRHAGLDAPAADVAATAQRLFGAAEVEGSDYGLFDLRTTPARPRRPLPLYRRLGNAEQGLRKAERERDAWETKYRELRRRYLRLRRQHAALRARYDALAANPAIRAVLGVRSRLRGGR